MACNPIFRYELDQFLKGEDAYINKPISFSLMKLINEIKAGGLTTTISPHDFKTTLAKFNSLVSQNYQCKLFYSLLGLSNLTLMNF
jgi:hypothetical protein